MRHSRPTSVSALLLIGALGLSACGGGDGGGEGEDVALSFTFWGSDTRQQITQDVIDLFEEENPGITVEAQFGNWDGYWDQLATQVAGGDAPDIIQMDEQYIREYADRGALMDLDQVDLSGLNETVAANGRLDDAQYGVTIGVNSFVMVANPELFQEAGVDMPDDTSWTWDDYADIAVELSDNLEGAYGAGAPREPSGFQSWLRQHDKSLSTDEGTLGFEPEDAEEYFEFYLELMNAGGTPPASAMSEDQNIGTEQSLSGSGQLALGTWWTNESVALSDGAGVEFDLLRFPTESGSPEDAKPWYKSSQYLSGYSRTDHPEEVQQFIDFFVNSPEAGEILGVERGLPPNTEILADLSEDLEGMEAVSAEYIEAIEPELGPAEPATAQGGSSFSQILYRYQDELFFERVTPAEAAEAMYSEMQSQLQ
ncbi:ABC transporter substrate-binding protein [Nesterenkonia halotolerans]|uniref:Multiple sugar transport system substrate-binding protein n=1 Tax=Nesterenkonia halotolerans TaxID=225325 RepID=A0ABR9J7Q7_9MICC|nr:extracellular solute-binding protein [Nesterenkonia halotolerans]MBE1515026.1 multiple sugar transport system substrate-binding protein [Nesterenkonia halotolerans]